MELALNTLAPPPSLVFWNVAWWPLSTLYTIGESVINTFVVRRLASLYLYGPIKLGFWGGTDPSEICAQLTNTHAVFWTATEINQAECINIIQRHFSSWLIFGSTLSYFVVILFALTCCCRSCCRSPQQIIISQRP